VDDVHQAILGNALAFLLHRALHSYGKAVSGVWLYVVIQHPLQGGLVKEQDV